MEKVSNVHEKYIVGNDTMDLTVPSLRRCPEIEETWESKKGSI